jgi:hypothetical protein
MTRILELLKKAGEASPNFRARLTYDHGPLPPIRAYLHNAGIDEAFDCPKRKTVEAKVEEHLIKTLIMNRGIINGADYLLAAIWGDKGAKMIDLFRYSGLGGWPGNPDFAGFVFRNGVYMPEKRELTCGDTLIVLGQEERYRRTTKDLKEYVEHSPSIDGLVSDTGQVICL